MNEQLLEAALGYALRGWPVFPVRRDKSPRTAHGLKDASTDAAQIRQWWALWADAGVAIRTGGGLLVLDVDGEDGEQGLHQLEREHGELPETVRCVTGAGTHYYFRGTARNSVGNLGPGLDIRGDGGYAIAPPSPHANGRRYEWDLPPDEADLAPAPGWLLAHERHNGPAPEVGTEIPEHERNNTLTSLAGTMRRRGMDESEILAALAKVNERRCRPSLKDREVQQIASSVARYEPTVEQAGEASQPVDLSSGDQGFPPAPAHLREQAFHGPAGALVRKIEPHTEADPAATLIQMLLAFGNASGRGPGFQVESDRHGTNEFAGIVGETSKSRKGTSWGHVRRTMAMADPEWVERCIGSGIASGEGLIHAVRDSLVIERKARTKEERERAGEDGRIEDEVDPGVSEKRLLVQQGELAQVLRVMQRDGNTVSPILRDLWDHGNARGMSKNQPERTSGSLVSLIGHITIRELRQELTEIEAGNGFGNRWLWVYAKRSKRLPRGGSLDERELQAIATEIRKALAFARRQGMLDMTEEAWEVWESLYAELSEGTDDLLGAVTARAEAHVRRLAVLYALLDRQGVVRVEHLRAAVAVWDYCEASAAYIFGGKVGDPLADKILVAIREAGEAGVSRTEIRSIAGGHVPGERIDAALRYLDLRGLAHEQVIETAGRPAHTWCPGTRSKVPEPSEQRVSAQTFPPTPQELSSDISDFEQRLEEKRRGSG